MPYHTAKTKSSMDTTRQTGKCSEHAISSTSCCCCCYSVCVCVCLSLSGLGFRVSLCVSLCPEMATEISTQRDSSRDITPKRGREDKSGQARFCARGDGGAMRWMCTHMHTHTHKCTRHKGSKGRIDQKRKGIKQWSIHYNTDLSPGFERPPAERRIGIPPPRESDDAVRDRNALP
jgi:hypothetical protein